MLQFNVVAPEPHNYPAAIAKGWLAGLWFARLYRKLGVPLEVGRFRIARTREERYQCRDKGDLFLCPIGSERLLLELKHRTLRWHNEESFPFQTIILDEDWKLRERVCEQGVRPFYVSISKDRRHAAVVDAGACYYDILTERMLDSGRRRDCANFTIDKRHARFCQTEEVMAPIIEGLVLPEVGPEPEWWAEDEAKAEEVARTGVVPGEQKVTFFVQEVADERVELTEEEFLVCQRVARQLSEVNRGRPDAAHYDRRLMQDDDFANLASCGCELAVAKYTGEEWHGRVLPISEHRKQRQLPDVGDNIEVRRTRNGMSVAVRSSDAGKAVWAVQVPDENDLKTYSLAGWVHADKALASKEFVKRGESWGYYPLARLNKPETYFDEQEFVRRGFLPVRKGHAPT